MLLLLTIVQKLDAHYHTYKKFRVNLKFLPKYHAAHVRIKIPELKKFPEFSRVVSTLQQKLPPSFYLASSTRHTSDKKSGYHGKKERQISNCQ